MEPARATVSGGTRQKLNLVVALLHDPDVLLLDEPCSGLDWEGYLRFWSHARELRERGKALLVVSHLVHEALRPGARPVRRQAAVRLSRIRVAFSLSARDLLRRRIVLLLMLLVPSVFYAIMFVITTTKPIAFQLSAIEVEDHLTVAQRSEALMFIGLAAVGVPTSFPGMNLSQRDVQVFRRLAALSEHTALDLLPTALKSVAYGALLLTIAFAVYGWRSRRL